MLTTGSVVALVVAYIFGMAWLQSRNETLYTMDELWVPRGIDLFIVAWLFWMGSAIGSFLNVVAWRMPRGVSVNGRSRCPRCQTALKARDNFPVWGWLLLGGRCRTCKLPISSRYPIVEASVGFSLTALGIGQLYNLSIPHQASGGPQGPFWTPVLEQKMLIVLIYHTVALASVWAMGLVRIDRQRLPGRLVLFAIVVVAIPMIAYPALMIETWQTTRSDSWSPDSLYIDAVMRVVSALVAAGLLGRSLAAGLCPTADPKMDPLGKGTAKLMDLVVVIAIPSLVVGWQVIPAVVVVASFIATVLRRTIPLQSDMLGYFCLAMPIALTLQLVFWRVLHGVAFWPSDQSSMHAAPWVILGWAALALAAPAWLREPPSEPEAVEMIEKDPPPEEDPPQFTDESE